MRYYIASGLGNVEQVRKLKAVLDAAGWEHTYDWTVHGAIYPQGRDAMVKCADSEILGVLAADIVITLLPGGRGTHTELGATIAQTVLAGILGSKTAGQRIVIYSADPEVDFGINEKTCAFYHHPLVERFDDWDEMIDSLLGKAS